MNKPQADMVRFLRGQADSCALLGSEIYPAILRPAADAASRGETIWRVLEPFAEQPQPHGVPLKLMGATHRLALEGRAPELAALYPSLGGDPDLERAWPGFEAVIEHHAGELGPMIERPVQTNEVGRSAALLGGFLQVARNSGQPLRLLEIGASAGLNLNWDRYLFDAGASAWGNPNSPVRIELQGEELPPLDVEAVIGARRGCDTAPLDPNSEEDRMTLLSYVWPDQLWRFEPLRAALELAQTSPVLVEHAEAGEWLEAALVDRVPGTATVVFHSLVMFWMDEPTQQRILHTIEQAGARATKKSSLAWLRMEWGGEQADVTLTTWPGAEEKVIARAGYHGRPVNWLR